MKNLFNILLLAGIFVFIGCQSELEQDPIGATTLEQAVSEPTVASVESAVGSSYQLLSNTLNILGDWDWGGGLVFRNDYILEDIASDDMEKKWVSDGDQAWMDEINNFTFTSTNGGPNGLWKYNYEGIKRANIAIDILTNPNVSLDISDDRKNQLLGEAYFLRSFYYFSLVTNFGDVPLILAPVKTFQEAFEVAIRVDKTEVWSRIKLDLQEAKSLLPNSKFSSNDEKWRASRGAAVALQAKAALYTEDWTSVIAFVEELENLGFYSLNSNYFDSFDVNKEFTDNEVIFSYDHQIQQNPRKGNGICALLGWGFFAPSNDFLNAFETNDPRKLYTVDVTNRNVNKILGTIDGGNKGNDDASSNKVYIRFADVLLWKAEALNEIGDYPDAVNLINHIRNRARNTPSADGASIPAGTLADYPASTDKTQIKSWLILERRVELGFESHRMQDLKRWGIAKNTLTDLGKNFQDKHMLYPIPQLEIDASAGTLTQNTGY
ncbi:MAG: RagB/SusD family nutrient uptake outer membrane protein [Aestuariibaculum sp.]